VGVRTNHLNHPSLWACQVGDVQVRWSDTQYVVICGHAGCSSWLVRRCRELLAGWLGRLASANFASSSSVRRSTSARPASLGQVSRRSLTTAARLPRQRYIRCNHGISTAPRRDNNTTVFSQLLVGKQICI